MEFSQVLGAREGNMAGGGLGSGLLSQGRARQPSRVLRAEPYSLLSTGGKGCLPAVLGLTFFKPFVELFIKLLYARH